MDVFTAEAPTYTHSLLVCFSLVGRGVGISEIMGDCPSIRKKVYGMRSQL